jgi:hypothetical protein
MNGNVRIRRPYDSRLRFIVTSEVTGATPDTRPLHFYYNRPRRLHRNRHVRLRVQVEDVRASVEFIRLNVSPRRSSRRSSSSSAADEDECEHGSGGEHDEDDGDDDPTPHRESTLYTVDARRRRRGWWLLDRRDGSRGGCRRYCN